MYIHQTQHQSPGRQIQASAFGILALAFACAALPATGENAIKDLLNLSLEDLANYVVVAPTRLETRMADAPGAISVITYDQIQNASARTIPDLLRMIPGVNVRWNPMVQTIDIRGFGSNPFTSKVLLLIDDVPYNSWNKGGFPQHPGFDFFNLSNVKHLEVIRGAGSALYGENAYNGVINIVTLSGKEAEGTKLALSSGSRNTRVLEVTHGMSYSPDTSFLMSARAMSSQLPTQLWSDLNDSDAEAYDIFLKAEHKLATLSYYRRMDDFEGFEVPLEDPGLPLGSVFRSADSIKQTVDIISLGVDHIATDKSWSVKGNLSYAARDGSHCAGCHARTEQPEFSETQDHGYQLLANLQVGLHQVGRHDLLIGAEVRRLDSGDHAVELSAHGKSGSHGSATAVTQYEKGALFLQDQIRLFDEQTKLVFGVRYDTQTYPDLFGDELSPRVALVSELSKKITARAGWNKSVRYPSFSELYQDSWFISAESEFLTIPLARFTPNPDLGPEHVESLELGVDYRSSDKYQIKLDLYRNRFEDSIIINYPRLRFENHPTDVVTMGAELDLKMNPSPEVTGFANWSYQHTDRKNSGADSSGGEIELTYAPRNKVNLGITYRPTDALTSTIELSWVGRYRAPAFWYQFAFPADPMPRKLSDYAYLNLNVDYRLPFDFGNSNRPLRLTASARNLFDERPHETLSGFGSRVYGRELFFALEYDWGQ